MLARGRQRMSEPEYLEWDRTHPEKHEYVNGEVVAMAGVDPAHEAYVEGAAAE